MTECKICPQMRLEELKRRFRELSLVEAAELATCLTPEDSQAVSEYLLGQGEYLLRLAAYLEGSRHDHGEGVRRQNTIGRAVRSAFGFSYPARGDVSF